MTYFFRGNPIRTPDIPECVVNVAAQLFYGHSRVGARMLAEQWAVAARLRFRGPRRWQDRDSYNPGDLSGWGGFGSYRI